MREPRTAASNTPRPGRPPRSNVTSPPATGEKRALRRSSREARARRRRRAAALALGALLAAGFGLRLAVAQRSTLWVDEIFSLAVATGHSLEHPAAAADPARGDFVEGADPRPREDFVRYVRNDTPPAGPARVLRAVSLSDTSPPLYYLLLGLWTQSAGTSDLALRAFSLLAAVACVPLLWALGRAAGGRRAAWLAPALFAFAPASVYYSTEGRMYALVWLFALALAWASVRWSRLGTRAATVTVWIGAGAAGLLTHYFFAFVWLACVAALVAGPGPRPRPWHLAAAVALTVAAVAPWYIQMPESLARWRVTGGWLDGRLSPQDVLLGPPVLAWSLLSGRGHWGGWPVADAATAIAVLLIGGSALARERRPLLSGSRWLLCLWLAGACVGPVVFDLLRHTTTSQIYRYALGGLPAASLLLAVAAARTPRFMRAAALGLLLFSWTPALRTMLGSPVRSLEPYSVIAKHLDAWTGPGDLVLVHSIPSGVIAVARYSGTEAPIAAWVEQLGTRDSPEDVARLVAGRRRVALVRIHEVGAPAPEEDWLKAQARIIDEDEEFAARWKPARLLLFAPRRGSVFQPAGAASLEES